MSESTYPDGTFSFGWNAERNEFVLWQQNRREPIAFVSLAECPGAHCHGAAHHRNDPATHDDLPRHSATLPIDPVTG